jgi:protein ImuB
MPAIVAERYFPEPLAVVESLMAALARLAHHVADTLERRREGGRAFEVRFFRADGKVDAITVGTAHATRDPALLMRLVGLRIEALADPLDPGFGFDAIRLAVTRSEPLAERQQDFTGGGRDEEGERALAELTGRLIARFGDRNVLRFVARETHDPARAGGASPCLSPTPSSPWPAPEPGHPPLRPLTLFEHPHPIEAIAEVPDGPPLKFRWRRVLHEVARAEGPESIAPEWWREGKGSSAARDYYRVEVAAGYRFWLFREGQFEDPGLHPRWILHGLFA